jgi:hypothetical protein
MLSFLYRLARAFQDEHGYRPNTVIMNAGHFRLLQESVPEVTDEAELAGLLGMEIMLSQDCVHPHVAWTPSARRASVG